MTQAKFETGATTHAVNDLILFTDNTRDLAAFRDSIYKDVLTHGWTIGTSPLYQRFEPLFNEAKKQYQKEFAHDKASYQHIILMAAPQIREYCQLYVDDFPNWKKENGYQ